MWIKRLNAIQNVIMIGGMKGLENEANKDSAESFGPLIEELEKKDIKLDFLWEEFLMTIEIFIL